MKSFLEFTCRRLLGPPVSGSSWRCPICESSGPSFSVRPPKEGFKIRWKCFRCDAWGDDFDLVKLLRPGLTDAQVGKELKALRSEYAKEHPNNPDTGNDASISQGPYGAIPGRVELAWCEFQEGKPKTATQILTLAAHLCEVYGVEFSEFVSFAVRQTPNRPKRRNKQCS